jgi:hypothetical protein
LKTGRFICGSFNLDSLAIPAFSAISPAVLLLERDCFPIKPFPSNSLPSTLEALMKVLSWLGAVGIGMFAGAWVISQKSARGAVRVPRAQVLNINEASQQELVSILGLDPEIADRIVEHRPYPSKIDLLGRMVIPEEVYVAIKDRIAYKAS